MRLKLLVVGVALAAIFVGCTVGPNYVPPKTPVPARYSESPATTRATTQPATQAAIVAAPTMLWWQNFRDPQLDSLIDRAVKSNLDLQAATARIRQARAQYGVAA